MIDLIYVIAKYGILLCMGLFTIISFFVQRDVPDEQKRTTFSLQRSFLLIIHGLSFFVLCLHCLDGTFDVNIWYLIAFYLAQLAYLLLMCLVLPRFVRLNQGLNHVMCMFLCIGFIIQTRLSFTDSIRQFIIVLVGSLIFLFFCLFCKRAKFLRNLTWIYCILGLGLLSMVLVLSAVDRGAKLSLELGPFSFQPLEFVKIIFVFFIASAFHHSTSFKNVVITAVLAAAHVLIQVACTDLGSAFILFCIYILMLYVATKKSGYLILGVAGFSAAAVLAYKLFSHVRVRVSAWLDPWSDIENSGWQIAHSLFAIGTGGWFGSGLLQGSPNSIPIVAKDMVISAISEEFGALFAIFLIALCLCYTLMIFRVAIRIELLFYKLLAFGLGVSFIVQVFLTVGGAFKFIPLTGVTLPFISSGGSSMLSSLITIGIVQALYVISEADVAHEKQMIAQGVDLSEFSGYEALRRETAAEKNYEDDYNDDFENDNDHDYKPELFDTNETAEFRLNYQYSDYVEEEENHQHVRHLKNSSADTSGPLFYDMKEDASSTEDQDFYE